MATSVLDAFLKAAAREMSDGADLVRAEDLELLMRLQGAANREVAEAPPVGITFEAIAQLARSQRRARALWGLAPADPTETSQPVQPEVPPDEAGEPEKPLHTRMET